MTVRAACSGSPHVIDASGTVDGEPRKRWVPTSIPRTPSATTGGNRGAKNGGRDAEDPAAALRPGHLPEGWINPPELRGLRELLRYRSSPIRHRTGAGTQTHGGDAGERGHARGR